MYGRQAAGGAPRGERLDKRPVARYVGQRKKRPLAPERVRKVLRQRLTDAGMTVYRTDMQGNILITVD